MRTTLTIEDDVAAELERLRRKNDLSFKEIVNDVLRRGLRNVSAPQKKKPFRTESFDAGTPLIDNIDNIEEVLTLIEGEAHK